MAKSGGLLVCVLKAMSINNWILNLKKTLLQVLLIVCHIDILLVLWIKGNKVMAKFCPHLTLLPFLDQRE